MWLTLSTGCFPIQRITTFIKWIVLPTLWITGTCRITYRHVKCSNRVFRQGAWLQNSRMFCQRQRRTIFERKVWCECKSGEGEWGRNTCMILPGVFKIEWRIHVVFRNTGRILGSITSRCSGKEPALLPRIQRAGRPDKRDRRKSSLAVGFCKGQYLGINVPILTLVNSGAHDCLHTVVHFIVSVFGIVNFRRSYFNLSITLPHQLCRLKVILLIVDKLRVLSFMIYYR